MPEMGESVTEGIVLEWHVAEGDFVNEGDTVVEVSTDKVDAEVPAPADGVITKLVAAVDDEVPVGSPLAEMEPATGPATGQALSRRVLSPRRTTSRLQAELAGDERPPRHPPVRRPPPGPTVAPATGLPTCARRRSRAGWREANGVDLGSVRGTGPGAKVTKEDVLAAGNGGPATAPPLRPPPARRSSCGGPRRCWPRRWTRAGRCRPRPRSGRSPSTPSTPSARRSTPS